MNRLIVQIFFVSLFISGSFSSTKAALVSGSGDLISPVATSYSLTLDPAMPNDACLDLGYFPVNLYCEQNNFQVQWQAANAHAYSDYINLYPIMDIGTVTSDPFTGTGSATFSIGMHFNVNQNNLIALNMLNPWISFSHGTSSLPGSNYTVQIDYSSTLYDFSDNIISTLSESYLLQGSTPGITHGNLVIDNPPLFGEEVPLDFGTLGYWYNTKISVQYDLTSSSFHTQIAPYSVLAVSVPEPDALLLFVLGLTGLVFYNKTFSRKRMKFSVEKNRDQPLSTNVKFM